MCIRDRSQGGQTNYCAADTRGGVRLVTQYSKHGCYQGDSWGYDRNRIGVSNGCRAQFQTGDAYSEHSEHSDHDNKHAAAAAVVALGVLGAVALANRHNNENEYRYNDDNEYRYESPPNRSYGYAPEQVVRCESRDNDDQYCAARVGRGRVEIQRQLSKSACRFNSSWGYDRNSICLLYTSRCV